MKRIHLFLTLVLLAATLFGSGRAMAANSEISALETDSGPKRIQFAPGATSAVVSGTLSAKSSTRYVLRALAGQLMDVNLSAPQGARLSVTTAAGGVLSAVTSSSTAFRGYLPASGDYILKVSAGKQALSFSINVSIPQRIAFERGATSAVIKGKVKAHQGLDYILGAAAGQLMEIDVTPEDSLQLIIFGVDGTVLKSGMGQASSFRGGLPLSEDYLVSVRAGDQDVSFTMNVIIPQRISFQPGAVSATVKGNASANHSQYYVLRARKNQAMQVKVTSPESVQLTIYGADGTVLKSGMGQGTSFSGDLPSTQDYVLVLRAGSHAAAYSLKVTIK